MFIELYNCNNYYHRMMIREMADNDYTKKYLGEINNDTFFNKETYVFKDLSNNYIGFISCSLPVETHYGISITLYYAIHHKYQNKGYGSKMLELFENFIKENKKIDIIVLNIESDNYASLKLAQKNNFSIAYQDDENYIYTKFLTKKRSL